MKRLIDVVLLVVVALLLAACSYVVEVDGVRHDVRVYPVIATATDAPRPTVTPLSPTPTLTPTQTVTATPIPPSASATPTPTVPPVTPTQEVTPGATATQESTEFPPPTPRPTVVPDDLLCMAGAINSNINIRNAPAITGAKIGLLKQAERVPIERVLVRYPEGAPNREEWGKLGDREGWVALWYLGRELVRLDDDAPCWELPIEYENSPLP